MNCQRCKIEGGLHLPAGNHHTQEAKTLMVQPACFAPDIEDCGEKVSHLPQIPFPMCKYHHDGWSHERLLEDIRGGRANHPPLITIPRILGGGTIAVAEGVNQEGGPYGFVCHECFDRHGFDIRHGEIRLTLCECCGARPDNYRWARWPAETKGVPRPTFRRTSDQEPVPASLA